MALVYGNDAYSGIQLSESSSWGLTIHTQPERIPLVSASDVIEVETIPTPDEIGSPGGGNPGSETASRFSRGEFTTRLDYNTFWFGMLMRQALGASAIVEDYNMFGTSASGVYNHIFIPASYQDRHPFCLGGTTNGLLIDYLKGGQASSNSLVDRYTGCIITGFTINQPSDGSPTITWRWIGKPTTLTMMYAPETVDTDREIATFRHIDSFRLETATDPVSVELQSFSLTYEKPLEFAPQFLNNLGSTTLEKPGKTGLYDVSFDLEAPLIQGTGSDSNPLTYFINATANRFIRLVYIGTEQIGATGQYYGMDITVPDVVWTAAEAPISSNDPLIISASGRGRSSFMRRAAADNDYEKWSWDALDSSNRDYRASVHVQLQNDRSTAYATVTGDTLFFWDSEPTGDIAVVADSLETVNWWFLQETSNEASQAQLADPRANWSGADTATYRLRFLVRAHGDCTNISQQLQYKYNGTAGWSDVTTGSTYCQINTSGGLTENGNCTKILSTHTFYVENDGQEGGAGADGEACDLGISPSKGEEFEVLFCLENQAALVNTDYLEFRLVNGTKANMGGIDCPKMTCNSG